MLFAVRRAVQHVGQLVVLGAVAAALSGTLAGATAMIDHAVDGGVARVVADADPMDRTLVIDAPAYGSDPKSVDAAIQTAFGSTVRTARSTWTQAPLDDIAGAGAPHGIASIVVVADPDIADHATLTQGTWPTGDEGAISAAGAALLHVAPGDTIVSGGVSIPLVGVWRPLDAAAAHWAGEPSPGSGRDGSSVGPVLVGASVLGAIDQGGRLRWTVTPAHAMAEASIASARAGIARLSAQIDQLNTGGLGMRVTGGWDATLARAATAAASARSVLAIPVVLLVVVGALVLGVLARGVGLRLRDEVDLLRRRGASRAAVLAEVAGISGAVGIVALAAGTLAGVLAGSPPTAALGPALLSASAAFVLITAVFTGAALSPPGARDDVTRQTVAGIAGAAVLAAVLAALAAAQLLTTGLAPDGSADIAAAAAPALAIIAAGLIGALIAGPVAAVAARAARGLRGLAGVLALRRLARRAPIVLAGVLSLSLAAGAALFAVVAVAGAGSAAGEATAAAVGADVRAVYDTSPIVDASSPALDARGIDVPDTDDGSAHVYTAFVSTITAGQVSGRLVALPAAVLTAEAQVAASDLAPGAALALGDTLELEVTASAPEGLVAPHAARASIRAWFVDPSGAPQTATVGTVPVDRRAHRLSVPVRAGDRLAAVEASAPAPSGDPSPADEMQLQIVAHGSEHSASLGLTLDEGRRLDRGVTIDDVDAQADVVVTRAFADALALHPGDNVSLALGTLAKPVSARVTAVRDRLPGIGSARGVAMDFTALTGRALHLGGSVPAADQIWAQTSDVAGVSAALRAAARTPVRIVTATSIGTAALIDPMLKLMTAGVAIVALLAVVGFAAVATTGIHDRREETMPLRAFGFTSAQQKRSTTIELSVSAALAVVVGVVAGTVIAVWLGPALVGALTAGGLT